MYVKIVFIVSIFLVENLDIFEYIKKSTQMHISSLNKKPCLGKRKCTITLPIFFWWCVYMTGDRGMEKAA